MIKTELPSHAYIDCTDKSIDDKRRVWNILKSMKCKGNYIDEGMFKEGNPWYDAEFFLISYKTIHPRRKTDGKSAVITYNEFMKTYGYTTWKERYVNK